MSEPPEEFLRFLEAQRVEYRAALPGKIAEIEAAKDLRTLERLAHNLAGSGATFGFAELGEAAKMLERVVQHVNEAGGEPNAQQRFAIADAIAALKRAVP